MPNEKTTAVETSQHGSDAMSIKRPTSNNQYSVLDVDGGFVCACNNPEYAAVVSAALNAQQGPGSINTFVAAMLANPEIVKSKDIYEWIYGRGNLGAIVSAARSIKEMVRTQTEDAARPEQPQQPTPFHPLEPWREIIEFILMKAPEILVEGGTIADFNGYFTHWDNITDACQKAWDKPRGYAESPTELICKIIDERDEALEQRNALIALAEEVQHPQRDSADGYHDWHLKIRELARQALAAEARKDGGQ